MVGALNKRILSYKLAITFIVLAILIHPVQTGAQPRKEIRIGSSTITFANISTYFARDRGFFEREGLDPKIILVRTEAVLAALSNQGLDYATDTTTAIEAALRGMPIRLIVATSKQPVWGLVVRKDIKDVPGLKGRKVGISSYGGASYAAALYVLRHYGLDPKKEVTVLATGDVTARIAGLKSGAIDAALIPAPGDIRATKLGDFKILLDVGTIYKLPMGGISTSLMKIRENPTEVKKVVRAVVESTRFLVDAKNKEEVIKYIAGLFKLDLSSADEIYRTRLVSSFTTTGMVDRDKIKLVIDSAVERGVTDKPPDPEMVVDFSFAKELGF